MPIIRRANVQSEEFLPGLLRLKLINAEFGAGHLDANRMIRNIGRVIGVIIRKKSAEPTGSPYPFCAGTGGPDI